MSQQIIAAKTVDVQSDAFTYNGQTIVNPNPWEIFDNQQLNGNFVAVPNAAKLALRLSTDGTMVSMIYQVKNIAPIVINSNSATFDTVLLFNMPAKYRPAGNVPLQIPITMYWDPAGGPPAVMGSFFITLNTPSPVLPGDVSLTVGLVKPSFALGDTLYLANLCVTASWMIAR